MPRPKGSKNKNPLSDRSRANMVAAKMGHSPTNFRKIIGDGVEYESMSAAALIIGISVNGIYQRVNSDRPKWSGWQYTTDLTAGSRSSIIHTSTTRSHND